MEVQIKIFSPIRIRQYQIFYLDNFNTLLVGATVGRTILGSVLSMSSKDTHSLDPSNLTHRFGL